MKPSSAGLAAAFALLGATAANAGVTLFPDFASWSAAVSDVVTVTIPDPSPAADIFIGSGDASVTYDSVTFSQSGALSNGNFFNVGVLFSGDPAVLSSQEQTTGVPNILITLPEAVTSLSFSYGTFDGSGVSFLLSNGYTTTLGSTGSGYVVPDFFGITDTVPFTTVLLTTSSTEVLNLNNVAYGSTIPEASTWVMMVAGFAALGFASYRRKASAFAAT